MREKIFTRLLIAVLAVCVLLTAAHFLYAAAAYGHTSILYFVAKELW